jgi:mannonate dehydratase
VNRRNILTTLGAAGTGLLAGRGPLAVAQQVARRGMPPLKITDVKVILTQPANDHLVIVKVMTNEPGLYGVGCAGVTLNNALSGIDGALWDILGKRCDVPVYKLLGGKVRTAVPLYGHASARDFSELEDQVRKWMSQGYRHVRVQLAVPGFAGYA